MKHIDLDNELKNAFDNDSSYLKLNKEVIKKLNSPSLVKKMSKSSWIGLAVACIVILTVVSAVVVKYSYNGASNSPFVCQYTITLDASEKTGWLASIVGDDNQLQIAYSNDSNGSNVVTVQGSNGKESMPSTGSVAYQNGIELAFLSTSDNAGSKGTTLFLESDGQKLTGISTKFYTNDVVLMDYKYTAVSNIDHTGNLSALEINSSNSASLPTLDLGTGQAYYDNSAAIAPSTLPIVPTVINIPINDPIKIPVPTSAPTDSPENTPTDLPPTSPTTVPTSIPTDIPTLAPASRPSYIPKIIPTSAPADPPTSVPKEHSDNRDHAV